MLKGKVMEYDPSRGCGSIIDLATGRHLTIYANYINFENGETLTQGQEVTFEIESKRSENCAVNVKIVPAV